MNPEPTITEYNDPDDSNFEESEDSWPTVRELHRSMTDLNMIWNRKALAEKFQALSPEAREILEDILEIQEMHREGAQLAMEGKGKNQDRELRLSTKDRNLHRMPYGDAVQSAYIQDRDTGDTPQIILNTSQTDRKWFRLAKDETISRTIAINTDGSAKLTRKAQKHSLRPSHRQTIESTVTVNTLEETFDDERTVMDLLRTFRTVALMAAYKNNAVPERIRKKLPNPLS